MRISETSWKIRESHSGLLPLFFPSKWAEKSDEKRQNDQNTMPGENVNFEEPRALVISSANLIALFGLIFAPLLFFIPLLLVFEGSVLTRMTNKILYARNWKLKNLRRKFVKRPRYKNKKRNFKNATNTTDLDYAEVENNVIQDQISKF